ncbi:MAG TPA: UDP-N-acetylglucosamine 2-epimerase (non-hydrolyzing) [Bacteroidia bacterium]|jgi:UDP-GlcNAc3NAcA epimerase|nr:UDP-N-acetylglucosamine 2-epimerase (non-hydrolyzing) [Bacteroidia bacterium]
MLKIVTIIGARPQIIKAAALSRAIKNKFADKIQEVIIHTGQHYDDNMSKVFFDELGVPQPDFNLNIRLVSHGEQTGAMISGIEKVIQAEKPSCIVVYGDTNSTLSGAIASSKINIPVIHIEAGLRSFNKLMPEEVNRILCDHVSTLLFCPTKTGYDNLLKEGFKEKNIAPYNINNPKIYHCGDIMYDNSIYFSEIAEKKSTILKDNDIAPNEFILATIHRNTNTDDPVRLSSIFSAIKKVAETKKIEIVIPLHPRTAKQLEQTPELYKEIKSNKNIKIIPPVSFLEMICLEKNSKLVITDSGGVQKEAFFFKKPCVILRSETEWIELVSCGAALLVDTNETQILNAVSHFFQASIQFPAFFGDGKTAEFICKEMLTNIN